MRSSAHHGGGERGRAVDAGASHGGRRLRIGALAVGTALAAGAFATAQGLQSEPDGSSLAQAAQSPSAAVKDRRDSRSRLDLRRVRVRQIGTRKLEVSFAMHDDWDGRDLEARGNAIGSVCLRIWTRRRPGGEPPDYLACLSQSPRDERELVGRVLRERSKGLPRVSEGAAVGRRSDRRVVLRFMTSAIKAPRRIRFSAEAEARSTSCSRLLGCVDVAPDRRRTVPLRLRKP